jgi:hypothetical protein
MCKLKLSSEIDSQKPNKLGNKLIRESIMEKFDAQFYIKSLYDRIGLRFRKYKENFTWCQSSIDPNVCELNPLGWDSLHYYCWVNTELNRALIATYVKKKSQLRKGKYFLHQITTFNHKYLPLFIY